MALSKTVAIIFVSCLFTAACANNGYKSPPVYESLYSIPFPLANGGETNDVLVRVTKAKSHYFNLVFVVKSSYSKEQKDNIWRAIRGWADLGEFERSSPPPDPYPLKFRFQLDAVDGKTPVHLDKVVTEVRHVYSSFPSKDTAWHAKVIHGHYLEPGIYRLRIENLKPCPELEGMETLFQFEAVERKA